MELGGFHGQDIYLSRNTEFDIACFAQIWVSRAYLFGSYSRGEAAPERDIDLRVDCDQLKGSFGLGGLCADLENACEKKVDLVISGAMNYPANIDKIREFRENIKEDERLIYEKEY